MKIYSPKKMKVNVDKTKIVVFSKRPLPRNLIFIYNGTNIWEFIFLGLEVSKFVNIIFMKKLLKLYMK
jgi:hypothetical protein